MSKVSVYFQYILISVGLGMLVEWNHTFLQRTLGFILFMAGMEWRFGHG